MLQQTSEHSNQSQDLMEVEDLAADAPTIVDTKLSNFEKMQKAMGRQQQPMSLA